MVASKSSLMVPFTVVSVGGAKIPSTTIIKWDKNNIEQVPVNSKVIYTS